MLWAVSYLVSLLDLFKEESEKNMNVQAECARRV